MFGVKICVLLTRSNGKWHLLTCYATWFPLTCVRRLILYLISFWLACWRPRRPKFLCQHVTCPHSINQNFALVKLVGLVIKLLLHWVNLLTKELVALFGILRDRFELDRSLSIWIFSWCWTPLWSNDSFLICWVTKIVQPIFNCNWNCLSRIVGAFTDVDRFKEYCVVFLALCLSSCDYFLVLVVLSCACITDCLTLERILLSCRSAQWIICEEDTNWLFAFVYLPSPKSWASGSDRRWV